MTDRAKAEERARERMFPIQDANNIPWRLIAPHEKRAQKNHNQTLERLAERGGLGAEEAMDVLLDLPWGTTSFKGRGASMALSGLAALIARVREVSRIGQFCEVCFHTAWTPVPENDPDALALKDGTGFVRCDFCWLDRLYRDRNAEVERIVLGLKEELKHTSHKDGLGMGDQRSESVCDEILKRLREKT